MKRSILVGLIALPVLAPAMAGDALVSLGPFHGGKGELRARIEAPAQGLALNRISTWTLVLEDASGAPVTGAKIGVDGRVPGHARVMPTAPRMVAAPAPGRYEIGGIKFDMAGRWRLRFNVERDGRFDLVIADVEVK